MTAAVTRDPAPLSVLSVPLPAEQRAVKNTPGTLWERVAESAPSDLDRYALMLGFGHNSGLLAYDNMRNLFAKRWALERAKAAHPAGKGLNERGTK